MKKIIVMVLAVLMLSITAFAGPYFTLENDGAAIAPTFTGGADFSVSTVDGPRVFGDAHWDLPMNDAIASIGVGYSGIKAEVETLLDFNKNLNRLLEWDTSFTITGYPFTGIKVWGGVSFNYDLTPHYVHSWWDPIWALVPVFGIEGRW